jgi:50S ribosomal protein L16 3-hydroxylase
MSAPLGDLSPEQFLNEFWQKKPCLIRQAFKDFEPLLDGNDLAGLACEEMAESRLILGSGKGNQWEVRHGPFEESEFANLPEDHWTLLVQDVEKHYAPLQELLQQFSFIPNWRLDDLMISYAEPGGSVGPHVDQYDVFLLQAEGSRRWQIAENFEPALLEDCPLNMLREFSAEQEWLLNAGDMLYLPPNVAHHGVAITAGMTWSIGARAPSAADLLQGLGEWLAFSDDHGGRFSDPELNAQSRPGEIDQLALSRLHKTMSDALSEKKTIDEFLGQFMSRFRMAHEPVPLDKPWPADKIRVALESGKTMMRNPWTRLNWVEKDEGARLYAAGHTIDCEIWLAEILCQSSETNLAGRKLNQTSLNALTCLINSGHYIFI